MIHRALLGSFERFIGILIEHYAGEFPLWLAPGPGVVLPIADRHVDYAREVARASCAAAGLRVRGRRPHRVGRASKIREAELRKVPVHAVVGDREAEERHGRGAPPPRGRPGAVRSPSSRPACVEEVERDACSATLYSPRCWAPARARTAERPCPTHPQHTAFDASRTPASAGPAEVRSAPARAGHDANQRADPRARGAPDRRGRQPDRRDATPTRRCSTRRSAISTSSRSPPRPARRSAACSTTRSTSTSRSRRRRPRASTSSR